MPLTVPHEKRTVFIPMSGQCKIFVCSMGLAQKLQLGLIDPLAAFGGAPPLQGGEFIVPLEKGDGREAAGGQSHTELRRTFVQSRSINASDRLMCQNRDPVI